MSKLKNCPECGKIFVENIINLCPECRKKELEDEDKVAEYLRETKKASLEEIHKATGVKEKVILRMLNRGRIIGDFEVSYPCETCGTPITSGRVCAKCAQNIVDQLPKPESWKAPEVKEPKRNESRMYSKDLRNK